MIDMAARRGCVRIVMIVMAVNGLWHGNQIAAQEAGESTQLVTNLDVMRDLAGRISGRVFQQADLTGVTDVDVTVLPKESSWYIESGILEKLLLLSIKAKTDGTSPVLFEFGLRDVRIEYSNVRKEWLFGSRVVDRTIQLRLAAKIVDRRVGEVKLSTEFSDSQTDTINLSDVSSVENPNIPMTKGQLPRQGFLSNFAEPLVIVGSVAVAVLLLFNVRS